ncbi:MAG: beta-galactosidase trimerization domain-containing protein, partial [Candidatus Eisenbacteria bacterium]|nr:beta-galactosidase trimerization domain-containing protein [Candidatus Eisenbacteria bacterium]
LLGPGRVSASHQSNVIVVNGLAVPLLWAAGLTSPADLDYYATLGLNTVNIRLASASPGAIASASQLAAAAEARGLFVVITLAPRSVSDESGGALAPDPRSQAYASAVGAFVSAAVESLGDYPHLIAWGVAVRPSEVVVNDTGFAQYLRDWYPSLAALNSSWGTDFTVWDEVTMDGARDVDSGLPMGVGRASIDYAYYVESAYADVMSRWREGIRAADAKRPVLAMDLPDYRSIISLRPDFDGMVLRTMPSAAEFDRVTHNVHAVDIARRGNVFAAVQTLDVQSATDAEAAVAWAGLAFSHGAAGVALSSWAAVRDSDELSAAVEQIAEMAGLQGYPQTPRAQAALIYEPFAGGVLVNGRALYGYLDGLAEGTPTTLFSAARAGTRYGLIDVLRWEQIATSDLSQYGVIIAPAAYYLPEEAQIALQNYVLRGGAFIADAGVGMYQAEGTIDSMPAVIREVTGLRYLDLEGFRTGNDETRVDVGEVYNPAVPTETLRLAPGQEEAEEVDPGLTRFVQSLELFLTRADVAQYLGEDMAESLGEGFRVSGLGEGFAVYAPDSLYDMWDGGGDTFFEFHDRVLAHGSDLEVVEPTGIWPGIAATFYEDWSVGVASPYGEPVAVLTYGAGNQVYQVPFGASRIRSAVAGDVEELLFPGAPLASAATIPVHVWPQTEDGVATVSVIEYSPDRIELAISGSGAGVRVWEGEVRILGGAALPVRIEIGSGAYRLPASGAHRVTIEHAMGGRSETLEMMPDPDTGSLAIDATLSQARILIEPAA